MRLKKTASGPVILSRLNAWELNTLRSVAGLADPGDAGGVQRRLFPPPAVDEDLTPEMAADWVEYVVPDLRDRFRGALETLSADVAAATPEPPEVTDDREPVPADTDFDAQTDDAGDADDADNGDADDDGDSDDDSDSREPAPPTLSRITIPADHVEPWYLAMNQARLVMSARYAIDPADPPDFPELIASGNLERWFQYDLLCALQSWLLVNVMNAGDESDESDPSDPSDESDPPDE